VTIDARIHSPRTALSLVCSRLVLVALAAPLAADDGDPLSHGVAAFDLGGDNADSGMGIAGQSDGKVVVVGTVQTATGSSALALARFLPTGALDATFGVVGRAANPFGHSAATFGRAVAVQPDGRIVVVGTYTWSGNDTDFLVGRLLSNGSPDPSFSSDGWIVVPFDVGGNHADRGNAVALQSNGRVVVAGAAAFDGNGNWNFAAARLDGNGVLDPTFDSDGRQTVSLDFYTDGWDEAYSVAVDSLGRIVLAGATEPPPGQNIGVARLLANGALDLSFNNGAGRASFNFSTTGPLQNDVAWSVAVDARNRIVLGCSSDVPTGSMWVILRMRANGTFDDTFPGGSASVAGDFACGTAPPCTPYSRSVATGVAVQGDGRIVFGGYGKIHGTPDPPGFDFGVGRLLDDGALDPTFGGGDGLATFDFARGPGSQSDFGAALGLANDGRILVGGSSEWFGSDYDFAFVRFASSYIFADGVESASTAKWSAAAP
jgi:uncharacterized delta-60 repeat protein